MLPVATQLPHLTYTLSRVLKEEMVGMDCQEETAEMESQEAKERRETLVCQEYLEHEVYK